MKLTSKISEFLHFRKFYKCLTLKLIFRIVKVTLTIQQRRNWGGAAGGAPPLQNEKKDLRISVSHGSGIIKPRVIVEIVFYYGSLKNMLSSFWILKAKGYCKLYFICVEISKVYTTRCKDLGIRIFELVAKTQFQI